MVAVELAVLGQEVLLALKETREIQGYRNGDATGMQASILFEGGTVEPPPMVVINQAMSGGM